MHSTSKPLLPEIIITPPCIDINNIMGNHHRNGIYQQHEYCLKESYIDFIEISRTFDLTPKCYTNIYFNKLVILAIIRFKQA